MGIWTIVGCLEHFFCFALSFFDDVGFECSFGKRSLFLIPGRMGALSVAAAVFASFQVDPPERAPIEFDCNSFASGVECFASVLRVARSLLRRSPLRFRGRPRTGEGGTSGIARKFVNKKKIRLDETNMGSGAKLIPGRENLHFHRFSSSSSTGFSSFCINEKRFPLCLCLSLSRAGAPPALLHPLSISIFFLPFHLHAERGERRKQVKTDGDNWQGKSPRVRDEPIPMKIRVNKGWKEGERDASNPAQGPREVKGEREKKGNHFYENKGCTNKRNQIVTSIFGSKWINQFNPFYLLAIFDEQVSFFFLSPRVFCLFPPGERVASGIVPVRIICRLLYLT